MTSWYSKSSMDKTRKINNKLEAKKILTTQKSLVARRMKEYVWPESQTYNILWDLLVSLTKITNRL